SPPRVAVMIDRQTGQSATKPRRGSDEVKFTFVRSRRTTSSVWIGELQEEQFAPFSRVYSASISVLASSATAAAFASGLTAPIDMSPRHGMQAGRGVVNRPTRPGGGPGTTPRPAARATAR